MSAPTTSFSMVALTVGDLERSRRFWSQVCGLAHVQDLDTPTFSGAILGGPTGSVELIEPRDGSGPTAGPDKIILTTTNVRASVSLAEEFGAAVPMPPREIAEMGIVLAKVLDPDGYVVEFVQTR